MIFLLVILIIIVVPVVYLIVIYNTLVRIRQRVKNAWSQVDVQLKRRHDLIPNLVEIAKKYMAHEQETLEKVIKARNMASGADGVGQKKEAENFLTGTLKSLFSVAENYPNLKADTQMLALQEQLTSTENKIAFARQFYNDEVMRLNTQIEVFPANQVAAMLNFSKEDFFEIEDASEKKAPKVDFK
ncbi:LemA family protein [Candidatus Omnitrophota bacterium]